MADLRSYLQDPLLHTMWTAIRNAGPLRSIAVDLTHRCNLRCTGCYYFEEGMDRLHAGAGDDAFDAFIEREKARGTNFVTIVGGEPSLEIGRIKKLYAHFRISVATNGIRRIPAEGLEQLPVGISVWGNHDTDRHLRGNDQVDVFAKALKNYRNDPRAFWYYTVAPGLAAEVESVVEQCIENGNPVLFNYYSDLSGAGGSLDHRQGFEQVREAVDRMIERYPDRILMTAYFNQVVATGRLFDQHWGFDVCTNLSTDFQPNLERLGNGNVFNPHFRAYNADFESTRRCCTGVDRDCGSCFDTWEHFSWIMANARLHLGSQQEFTNWLSTSYLFYAINRLVDTSDLAEMLPQIHRRAGNYAFSEG